ncbi:hypothetical protein ACTFIY_008259 [Dictyostelium cf. discoideum]
MKDSPIFSITIEDVEKICYAIQYHQCGELYRFLGVKKEDTIDKIAHTYKEIKSSFVNDKIVSASLDAAYEIISDKRLRDYYDEKMYDDMVRTELEYFQSLNQKNQTLLSTIGALLAPLEIASLVINTTPSAASLSSLQILGSFIKKHSAFSLGKIVLTQAILPSTLAMIIQPLFLLKDKYTYSFTKVGKLTDEIVSYLSTFIITFPLDCYMQTAHNLSLLEVVKKVVLCQDGVSGKLNFKNLAYTFISSFGMYAFSRLIRIGYNKVEAYVESKSLENPNSTFWRNSLIIKSIYVKSIFMSLFLIPYETIHSQYSYLYVQRYLGKPTLSLSINPISLAVDLVKSQGYRKLYKSLPFSYISLLLEEYLISNLSNDL